jgi:hypothetical protein
VKGLFALEEFLSDRLVGGSAVTQERSRHRQSLFGIIGRLANAPFIPLPGITGNDVSRLSVESGNPAGIPTLHIGSGQHLGLFANRVTRRQALETADYALRKLHSNDGEVIPVSHPVGRMLTSTIWRQTVKLTNGKESVAS